MPAITAAMVGELRAKTDAPMMECKKALTEADGDLAKAEEIPRVKLGSKASKAASRIEGPGGVHNRGRGDPPRPRRAGSPKVTFSGWKESSVSRTEPSYAGAGLVKKAGWLRRCVLTRR